MVAIRIGALDSIRGYQLKHFLNMLKPKDLKVGDLIAPMEVTFDGWYTRGLRLAEVISVNDPAIWDTTRCVVIALILLVPATSPQGFEYNITKSVCDVRDFIKL
jgi:hypothetical protein